MNKAQDETGIVDARLSEYGSSGLGVKQLQDSGLNLMKKEDSKSRLFV
jgi:hypothetical protein